MTFQVRYLALQRLFSIIDDFKGLWMGRLQRSVHGPTFFLLYINDLPDDAICNITIYTDDFTLYSNFDQASDM